MGVSISGTGSYLPSHIVSREDWATDKQAYGKIPEDLFDIPKQVHHAKTDETASFMGTKAALEAVKAAGKTPEDIEMILCFSVINDYLYPKDGQQIVHLGKFTNATALDMDLACASFQSLMKVGACFINQKMHKNVLIVATANWVHRSIDKTQDYSPLGDGAAAILLEESEVDSFIGIEERREERFFNFVRMNNPVLTKNTESIQFTFTDDFKHFLKTNAVDVAKSLMSKTKHFPDKIDWFICHQVGQRALRGWCRNLELGDEKLLSTFDFTGNCMASNMPLVLHHYIEIDKKIKRGDVILMYALSSGFHASAMLWRY